MAVDNIGPVTSSLLAPVANGGLILTTRARNLSSYQSAEYRRFLQGTGLTKSPCKIKGRPATKREFVYVTGQRTEQRHSVGDFGRRLLVSKGDKILRVPQSKHRLRTIAMLPPALFQKFGDLGNTV